MHPLHAIYSAGLALALTTGLAQAQQTSPPSTTSTAVPATDTRINQRDRSSHTLTPMQQPNDKADIRLVAAVRRAIVKDKSLSLSAHNVKVVAIHGEVTLRGPVKNDDEKAQVEAIVKGVSGVTQVDNQLDVKN